MAINEPKESIFQILRSDKGLQSSEDKHKERKDIPLPTIPKLESKKLRDGFDKILSQIDKATGFKRKRGKRSVNENQNPSISHMKTPNTKRPTKTA